MGLPATLSLVMGSLCADEALRYVFKVGGARRDSETWRTRWGWGEEIGTLPGLNTFCEGLWSEFHPYD